MYISFRKNNSFILSSCLLLLIVFFFTAWLPQIEAKQQEIPSVAFITGHNELPENMLNEVFDTLSHHFQVDIGTIPETSDILNIYKVVIIASPLNKFTERDKSVLNQYVMQGGRLLWFLNAFYLSKRELHETGKSPSSYLDLNLNDMLFSYGVRISPNIVIDEICDSITVNIETGSKIVEYTLPWVYAPRLLPASKHFITNNLSHISSEFVSGIEFIGKSEDVKRTVLLTTSGQGRALPLPDMITLPEPDDKYKFTQNEKYPVAVLIEGHFSSAFRNQFSKTKISDTEKSIYTKMVIVSSGSLLRDGSLSENKVFLINTLQYLSDENESERNHSFQLSYLLLLLSIILLVLIIAFKKNKRT